MLTKKKIYLTIIIILVIAATGIYLAKKEKPAEYETIIAEKAALVQSVSVTGSVKPAEEVALAFEKGGKVSFLSVKVGDKVTKGKLLAQTSNADLAAQFKQAKAGVDSAKALLKQYAAAAAAQEAKLDEYKKGARPEEIQLAETTVNNAEKSLSDAENSLLQVKAKAAADLNEDYSNALSALASSITVATNTLNKITDIQFTYFNNNDQNSTMFATAKEQIVYTLLGQNNAGKRNKDSLSALNGGAKLKVSDTSANPTQYNIDNAIAGVKNMLQTTKNSLASLPIISSMSSTDLSTLNAEKNNIDSEISTINSKEQAISVQKAANQSAMATAEAAINTAKNNLNTAKDQLSIKKAGYSPEQISGQQALVDQAIASMESQKAQIKSAEANALNYQAQIAKTVIISPIKGIITAVDAKLGEIAAANATVIKIISEDKFQIEANVPEVDIANIKINDVASVTLDAYGSDQAFQATVIKIDPAETLIDNVPTYKVTFEFAENSEQIKSGMTADLEIITAEEKDAVSLPQRAILKKNGVKIIRILNSDGENFTEVSVKTGLRGENGLVEIIEGVTEGDKVVLSVKK